jgi:hypothetical protein
MLTPALFGPLVGSPSAQGNVSGYVNNNAGDPAGFNKALPFSLNTGLTYTTPTIYTAGFRSFLVAFQVSAGGFELHFLELHPTTLAVVADNNFATYVPGNGHLGVGVGALAGNGGGGGGPLFTGGLDGMIPTLLQIQFKATVTPSTISAFDGLWCGSV